MILAKYRDKYLSQRDNRKAYWIEKGFVVGQGGKVFFPESELEKREHELYDRTTECFISSGCMLSNALNKAGLVETEIDELSYGLHLEALLRGKETRFDWLAHQRSMNKLSKGKVILEVSNAKDSLDKIKKSIDDGFPCLLSIWIKPFYPSGKGHIVVVVGYIVNEKGVITAWVIDDPFGKVLTRYRDINGELDVIEDSEFKKLINSPLSDGNRKCGIVKIIKE